METILEKIDPDNPEKSFKNTLEYLLSYYKATGGILFLYDKTTQEIISQFTKNLKEKEYKPIIRFILKDIEKILDKQRKSSTYKWEDFTVNLLLLNIKRDLSLNLILIDANKDILKKQNNHKLLGKILLSVFLNEDNTKKSIILRNLVEQDKFSFIFLNKNGEVNFRLPSRNPVDKKDEIAKIENFSPDFKDIDIKTILKDVYNNKEKYVIDSIKKADKGETKYYRITIYPPDGNNEELLPVIIENTTELERLHKKLNFNINEYEKQKRLLERKIQDSGLLFNIATMVTSSLDIKEVAENILKALAKNFGLVNAGILIVDEDKKNNLKILADFKIDKKHKTLNIPIGPGSITGMVAKTGKPIIVKDTEKEKNYLKILDESKSEIAIPLIFRDEIIGVLNVESPVREAFGQEDLETLTSLSSIISIALNNAKLFRTRNKNLEELKHISKIKSDFISIISHEFRTPLTTIIGYMDILKEQISDDITEFQKNCINSSIREAHKLSSMVDQILHIQNIETSRIPLQKEWLSTEKIINSIIEDSKHLIDKKNTNISKNIQKGTQIIYTDEFSIYIILKNLIDNAIKFTPENGSIEINIENPNGFIIIEISDSGIGIEEKFQNKIFEQFFQIDNKTTEIKKGIGVGLYIVKELVELLGGEISVSSKINKGSTFTIKLPQPEK